MTTCRFYHSTCVVFMGAHGGLARSVLSFIIGSEACELGGNDVVTVGNEESCLWRHCNF